MRNLTLRSLATLLAIIFLAPCQGLADATYLGPLTVRLVETGAEGKLVPIPHQPVWVNARHADTDAEGNAVFDGIPAGRHAMKIHLPGFAAVDRPIDLAAGTRAPVEVVVPRTPPVTWDGSLIDRASGLPVVGARVSIRPVDVAAALRGGGQAISDWDGIFRFVNLSPGRYALSAEAGGFEPVTGEFEAGARTRADRDFAQPMLDGVALDICRQAGSECGKPAADAYCREQGMAESVEHKVRNDAPPTRIIGSGKVCSEATCDRIDWLRCTAPSVTAKLPMTPLSQPARAAIKVVDSRSRQPVAGARVTLAEAWPSGEIAQGTTGADGTIAFPELQTGAANWPDGQGKLLMARKRITARIEADGYFADVVPLALGQTLEANLTATAEQAELEPNDLNAPQDVLTGAPIRFSLENKRDHDAFRFRLSQPSRLIVTVGPDNPLETHLRIRDADAKLLRENGAYAKNSNRIELRLAAGTYYAEISEWGEDASAPDKPLILNLEVTPATDPNEPNDTLQAATPVGLGEQIAGLIWPVGDRDMYRIDLPRPGMLRILEPGQEMERHIRLLDSQGKLVQERGVYSKQGFDMIQRVEGGTYHIEVLEWGGDNASLSPYRLRLIYMPDDGIDDPPLGQGSLSAKRMLTLPETIHATLMPRGDIDVYGIALAGAGTLQVRSRGSMERHVQILDRSGKLLTEQGVYANNENHLAWQVGGPDTVFVSIREWGMDSESPTPYALSAWFEPADEFDFLQRNDDFDHATPIAPGETVRGSYDPRGDLDYYVLEADFPGILRVKVKSGMETHLRIYNSQRKLVTEQGVYANNSAHLAPNVAAGLWYVVVGEWGNDRAGTVPYELTAELERAEPGEAWPMTADAPRRLLEGVAQSFSFDHNNDIDRFILDFPPAKGALHIVGPLETHVRVYDDQTGKLLHESGHYAPAQASIPLEFKVPTRLRVELLEWGQDRASFKSGFIMFDTRGRPLASARITAKAYPDDPLRVAFSLEKSEKGEAASRCDLDINRDGRADLSVVGEQSRDYRFTEASLYDVESVCQGANGVSSRQRLWVQTTLPREKRGVALFLPAPAQGQALTEAIDLRAHAMSYDGKRIARVDFNLDGRTRASDYSAPFEASPTWASLAAGLHELRVTAYDDAGNSAEIKRPFTLSEFFGLTPPDGAVLTGENVRITWTGQTFGDSRVRYRVKGSEAWQEAVGQSARLRAVTLTGLEAGKPYEFQPLGASEGPVRTVTRVKGLAFSEARYGANIRRDYDQKVGISVRNNGDKPLKVRLECGKPADPLLLVGFVGEGSEDKPIDLGPGESRQFVLGISAQDVVSAEHRFPVRIVSDTGLSDEAEVAVQVKLPHVELVWEDKGAAPGGQGRLYRLVNKGDNLTDLAVSAADADKVSIYPTVRHGLLQAGQAQEFTVTPQYYEGFTGVDTRLIAQALDKKFEQAYAMQLAPGESARRIWLFPGETGPALDAATEKQAIANAEQAASLNPESLDWNRRADPEDTDRDGKPDRWSQRVGNVYWVGDDSDADGVIDFVHADIGDDGVFEYSAWKDASGWRPTNLVEAWLEMGFTLPWSRDSYKEHDAEIVLNGMVIGRLKDAIPEGNFTFRIPPKALKFDDSGKPAENQVGIHSKHLRGGHYVVNSDFRFKFRLTATPVWTVAKSEAEARANAARLTGVSVGSPDFSVSSAEMRLIGPATPKAGDAMEIEALARNLGASAPTGVVIALSRTLPSGVKEELARSVAVGIPLSGATALRIPFKARGGANTLVLTIDPDKRFEDSDRANNSASLFLKVAGDDKAPELQVRQPGDGQTLTRSIVNLDVSATDDQGIAALSLSIDGGLWQDLGAKDGAARRDLLLQPGEHRIDIKAVDFSDNSTLRKLKLTVATTPPALRIVAPANGARIDARTVEVRAEVPADAVLVAARSAGGPWYRGNVANGRAVIELPLDFGAQSIEVMAAGPDGSLARQTTGVECTQQPDAKAATRPAAADHGLFWPADRPDLEIDLFKSANGVFASSTPEARARAEAERLRAAAESARVEAERVEAENAALRAREAAETRLRAEENARQQREEEARLAEVERQRLADLQAREEAIQRQRAEAEERLRLEEVARLEQEARRAREAEALRQAEIEQQRLAEIERQRLAEMERQRRAAELAGAAALNQVRQTEGADPRDAELQRLREANARLQMEQELLKARNEAERLRLELELERTRNQAQASPVAPPPWPVAAPPSVSPTPTPQPAVTPVKPAAPMPKSKVLFEIDSDEKLKNDPEKPSKIELDAAHVITMIRTTHWNGGRGATPGRIGLQCRDGKTYGPWPATGLADSKGTPDIHWAVYPGITLGATTCSIIDSNPATWSHAADTKKRGLVRVEGYAATDAKRLAPEGTAQEAPDDEDAGMPADKMNILLDLFKKKR